MTTHIREDHPMTIKTMTEAERQLTHLANALPMLSGLDSETRSYLLELTDEYAQSYTHTEADLRHLPVNFLGQATRILRAAPMTEEG